MSPNRPPVACATCDYGLPCIKHGTGISPVPEQPSEKKLTSQKPYDHLYHNKRWRDLAAACIRRAPLCCDPHKIGCHAPAKVADHIEDHHGSEQLFWKFDNLQSMCKSCHSRKTGESHGRGGRNIEDLSPLDANGRIRGNG